MDNVLNLIRTMKRTSLFRRIILVCLLGAGLLHFPFSIFHFSYSSLRAQTFTDYLTRNRASGCSVLLHQDADLDALVNGLVSYASAAPRTVAHPVLQPDTLMGDTLGPDFQLPTLGRRMKSTGFRIQIYAGGNNRSSKTEAFRQANLVRSEFPEMNVYTKFISPRWTCRVGDFRTHEEAAEFLHRIRQSRKFKEASIVKSPIIVIY
jgi:hypothetical protein